MTNEQIMTDAQTLWDYHQLGHELRPTDIAIGLGSHDIGVAEQTADLYHQGLFPLIVFTGANAPTTVDVFPRGEATHFTERTVELGVRPKQSCKKKTRQTPGRISHSRDSSWTQSHSRKFRDADQSPVPAAARVRYRPKKLART